MDLRGCLLHEVLATKGQILVEQSRVLGPVCISEVLIGDMHLQGMQNNNKIYII